VHNIHFCPDYALTSQVHNRLVNHREVGRTAVLDSFKAHGDCRAVGRAAGANAFDGLLTSDQGVVGLAAILDKFRGAHEESRICANTTFKFKLPRVLTVVRLATPPDWTFSTPFELIVVSSEMPPLLTVSTAPSRIVTLRDVPLALTVSVSPDIKVIGFALSGGNV
jgi:hypothetical protein